MNTNNPAGASDMPGSSRHTQPLAVGTIRNWISRAHARWHHIWGALAFLPQRVNARVSWDEIRGDGIRGTLGAVPRRSRIRTLWNGMAGVLTDRPRHAESHVHSDDMEAAGLSEWDRTREAAGPSERNRTAEPGGPSEWTPEPGEPSNWSRTPEPGGPPERNRTTGPRRPSDRRRARTPALLAVVALFVAALVITIARAPEPTVLTYSEFIEAVDLGHVSRVTIVPGVGVRGEWADSVARESDSFTVTYPDQALDGLIERLSDAGVVIEFQAPSNPHRYKELLALTLQLLLFGGIGYLVFLNLKGQGGSGGIGGRAPDTRTTFADVAGTQGVAEELKEVVDFLRRPADYAAMGARIPRGVLLSGPPGTGKTLLARAVAGEANVPFFYISGSEVTGFIVGLGAHRIRTLFRRARKRGGVIFIDEIDSIGGRRGRNRAHNEDDRTLNQLLVEMDGFSPAEGVVVIGATNRPEELDPALLRPGRFDRTLVVALPTVDGREEILRLHATRRGIPLAPDVDLRRLARITPGASGADLANLLNEAAIAAVRERASRVAWRHIEQARDRMLLGKERVGFRAREEEWRIVAYHEAGHALAGVIAVPEDGLHKITIQPRGQAMGVAHFAPDDDRYLHSRRYLEGQIVKGLAGRAAEEVVFGPDQITGGAENDLDHVNRIARRMVYRLGMGRGTGLLVFDGQPGSLSPETQAKMDDEVRELLDRLYAHAREIVVTHRAALDALAEALLEHETLDGDEALRILAAHGVRTPAAA